MLGRSARLHSAPERAPFLLKPANFRCKVCPFGTVQRAYLLTLYSLHEVTL